MGFSFLALLFLQLQYMQRMVQMKKEQFNESVNRALYQASKNLELNETLRYLEKDINETERKAFIRDSINAVSKKGGKAIQHSHQYSVTGKDGTVYSSFELKTITIRPSKIPKGMILGRDKNSITEASRSFQELVKSRYIYQKGLLDEVVYSILYSASEKPLKERINFKLLDQDLKAELMNYGIDIPYHFIVSTQDGREVYRCPDYSDAGEEYSYSQVLFRNDPQAKIGIVRIHFPEMDKYIYSSVWFVIPSLIFTVVLLITFIFTIVIIFRQKKYTELKNDFINDESKRLRFLVEKVLQMSMFDKNRAIYKSKELDLNEMVYNIANTFTLRVEHTGGKIYTEVEAVDSTVYVDEMHFQNVIFNLLDNAVKYRKPDTPLDVFLKTWNEEDAIMLSIRDTGLGIKRDNLKKIFDKFYRVHTGNVHDVKGFGLGLAYVKQIVDITGGEITVESEYGEGTTFTIKLPIIKN